MSTDTDTEVAGVSDDVKIDEHGVTSTTIENTANLVAKASGAGEEPEQESEPQPKASASDHLVNTAKAFGYSDEEIDELGADRIQEDIARMDRRLLQLLQAQQPQQQQFTPPPGQQQQPQQPWQQQPQQPQQPQPFDWDKLSEEYDEGIVNPIKAMHEQLQQMQSLLQQQQQELYAQEQQEFDRWFDDQLSELGDVFHPVFGKGPTSALNPYSPEYAARQQAKQAWMHFRSIDQMSPDEALVSRAAIALHPEVYQQQTRNQLAGELKKRSRTTIGRPAGRKTHPDDEVIDPSTGAPRALVERLQERIERMTGGR